MAEAGQPKEQSKTFTGHMLLQLEDRSRERCYTEAAAILHNQPRVGWLMADATTLKTACTRDCPDACGIIATIEDGKVVRLQGDPDHPVTQGFLCYRTNRYLDLQYSPDRLTRPLVRREKSGRFEPIGWSDALDLTAEKMMQYREESGGASILQYRCGGSMGIMKHVGDHFFQRFGPVTVKSGDVCAGAGEAAQLADFGEFDSSDFFDLHHSKTIFLWGKNVFVSSVHLIPQLKRAKKNGARIVLIDPVHHRTASIADLFVQPRPGGDAAVALGMARWLFEHERADETASDYCDHFEAFRSLAFSRSLADWARSADIEEAALRQLAEKYARGPASILIGWGLQRRKYGAATIRAIDALTAISGNLGVAGGGASFYFMRRGAFDFSFAEGAAAARTIPEPLLGPGMLQAADPPIRMMFVWGANPVAMLPESETVAQAISSREFTVVVDPFMTDTAQCADLVLPTTTMLEEDDLLGAYGHHYLAEVRPVVPPPAGVLSDHGIFRELARRVGLAEEFDVEPRVWKERLLSRVTAAGVDRSEFDQGYVKNPFSQDVLFADRRFKTPTGKVNLIEKLPDAMLAAPDNGTLRLTSLSTEKAQASQWPAESQQGETEAVVHPHAAPGHGDGDVVELRSRHGVMKVRLRLDENQRRDMVLVDKGGWRSAGRCANSLIAAELTDDGECAVYYDTHVEIVSN